MNSTPYSTRADDMDVLRTAGIDSVDTLIQAAARFVREHRQAPPPTTAPLSDAERELLRDAGASGLDDDDADPAAPMDFVDVVGQYAQLLAGAYTTEAVCRRLGVVASRVRQRVVERSLYAIDAADGQRRFPAFQFADPVGALPRLRDVLPEIDRSVHPVTVERFFLTPHGDLESDLAERVLSPRDWLILELPVDKVVLLARDL